MQIFCPTACTPRWHGLQERKLRPVPAGLIVEAFARVFHRDRFLRPRPVLLRHDLGDWPGVRQSFAATRVATPPSSLGAICREEAWREPRQIWPYLG